MSRLFLFCKPIYAFKNLDGCYFHGPWEDTELQIGIRRFHAITVRVNDGEKVKVALTVITHVKLK